jgi:hypothetical protein
MWRIEFLPFINTAEGDFLGLRVVVDAVLCRRVFQATNSMWQLCCDVFTG